MSAPNFIWVELGPEIEAMVGKKIPGRYANINKTVDAFFKGEDGRLVLVFDGTEVPMTRPTWDEWMAVVPTLGIDNYEYRD